jgi:hypothetical protein
MPQHDDLHLLQEVPIRSPSYASYIFQTYEDGIFNAKLPVVTTDPNLLEEQARKAMSQKGFVYIYGGAGNMSSVDANRLAFLQWRIIPRVLKPCAPRDLRVKIFGVTYGTSPIILTLLMEQNDEAM